MAIQDRFFVPLTPFAREMLTKLAASYPPVTRATFAGMALEIGLRHMAVPSGAHPEARLPVAEGF